MNKILALTAAASVALLSGCATNAVKIDGPTTALPAARPSSQEASGGIYSSASFRPMFEDRRARFTGDTMLVSIVEKTSAANSTSNNASRTASADVTAPKMFGVPGKSFQDTNVQLNAASKMEDKDGAKNDSLFTGTITVTVVDVLANGNLRVAGEKQVGVNGEVDTVRFSGVVNPATIQPGNVVPSTQVADARIETVSRSSVDPARVAGFLGRFFMSFIPFR